MPMIDVYATGGTFANPKALARDLASTLMKIEQVPDIPMFRKNTAAFVHDLPDGALSNVEGDSNYVRVQVLTNAGALNRDKQLAVVRQDQDAQRGDRLEGGTGRIEAVNRAIDERLVGTGVLQRGVAGLAGRRHEQARVIAGQRTEGVDPPAEGVHRDERPRRGGLAGGPGDRHRVSDGGVALALEAEVE